jgi:tagatose 1,6-diphosphate aldolase GatY/KbaY
MLDLVGRAYRGGYAVPAFCAWNAESMQAVLRAAERHDAPVILMQGPFEFPVLAPAAMAGVARAVMDGYTVPAALHLDHGDSPGMVRACIEAGYTSVMLDYSTRSFSENVRALADVVRTARPLAVTVEGEIGRIGKADEVTSEGSRSSVMTDPVEASEYVKQSGVDLLAVSVGNKHGYYQGDPLLDFDLLSTLHATLPIPLVLHGGTGIPEADIARAIGMGIAKVNVASELIHTFRRTLSEQWARGQNLWTPLAVSDASRELETIAGRWIRMTGAAGRA